MARPARTSRNRVPAANEISVIWARLSSLEVETGRSLTARTVTARVTRASNHLRFVALHRNGSIRDAVRPFYSPSYKTNNPCYLGTPWQPIREDLIKSRRTEYCRPLA